MTKLVRNPIDAHVGSQVKLRRAVVGMSQTELANQLGITFQQVQKYEKGANRIGASRLYLIAEILNMPIEALFKGADDVGAEIPKAFKGATDETVQKYEEFIRSPEGIAMIKGFVNIDDPEVRKATTAFIKAVSTVKTSAEIVSIAA